MIKSINCKEGLKYGPLYKKIKRIQINVLFFEKVGTRFLKTQLNIFKRKNL